MPKADYVPLERQNGQVVRREDFKTIGYGHKITSNEISQFEGKTLTENQALALLMHDIKSRANIASSLRVQLARNEFEALQMFCFNIGIGNFQSSELLKRINSGEDKTNAYDYFDHWRKAGGSVNDGLQKRRLAELMIFAGRPLDPRESEPPSAQWGIKMPVTDENWKSLRFDLRQEAVKLFNDYDQYNSYRKKQK